MEGLSDMKSFKRSLPPSPSFSSSSSSSSSEISIFDAQKYYKERVAPVAAPHCEFHAVAASPTTAWSGASWSSQTEQILLNSPITKEKRRTRKLFFLFGIILCGCWGKKKKMKAVEDKEENEENLSENIHHNVGPDSDSKRQAEKVTVNLIHKVSTKSTKNLDSTTSTGYWPDRHEYDDHDYDLIPKFPPETHFLSTHLASGSETEFSFPILSQPPPPPPPANLVFTSARNPIPIELEPPPPRDSLEIFLPSELCISRKSAEGISHRIFAPYSGAHDRRTASTKSWGAAMDDDVASDGSSDLFEIEIFTTTTNCPMNEPSEAPINWSVTTAEGVDRGSVPITYHRRGGVESNVGSFHGAAAATP